MAESHRACHHCGTKTTLQLSPPTCSTCYNSLSTKGVLPDLNVECDVCGNMVDTNMERRYRMHTLCSSVVSVPLNKMNKTRRDKVKATLRRTVEEAQPEDLRTFLEDILEDCIKDTAGVIRKGRESIPYDSVPAEWGLARFMAKLDHNGERAREHLKNIDANET